MSILTGAAILAAIKNKEIKIEGLKEGSIGTESIDLHLGSEIKKMKCNSKRKVIDGWGDYWIDVVDPKEEMIYEKLEFNKNGEILLLPNEGYLAHTIEFVGSEFYHPQLHDKSSCMRIFASSHGNAGFGDLGFYGQWTLEIQVVKPTILYLGMAICQISFETVQGEKSLYSHRKTSKYMNQSGATESKIQNNFIVLTFESVSKLAHEKGLKVTANINPITNETLYFEIYEREDRTFFECKTLEEVKKYLDKL
jgi:dCTP deaminase